MTRDPQKLDPVVWAVRRDPQELGGMADLGPQGHPKHGRRLGPRRCLSPINLGPRVGVKSSRTGLPSLPWPLFG